MPPIVEHRTRNGFTVRKTIIVDLETETSDAELTHAMEQIPTDINLIEINHSSGNWPLFLRHLDTRENLRKVEVLGSLLPSREEDRRCILTYDAGENAGKRVELYLFGFYLYPREVTRYLDGATQLTVLRTSFEHWHEPENDGPPLILASAIQRHPHLRELELGCFEGWTANYISAIFNTLHMNTVLQKIKVNNYETWTNETVEAFQKFMRSTMTIRELVVRQPSLATKRHYFELIKNNFSLRSITFEPNEVNDEDDREFQDYFDRNARVEEFVNSPSTAIPNKKLYPEVLGVVAQANPSILFQSVKAALPEFLGSIAPGNANVVSDQHHHTRKRPRVAN